MPALQLALIACSATKLPRVAPARELYIGALFRKSLAYAERRFTEIRILSGKHGLVRLDTVLAPYDLQLSSLSAFRRVGWGADVRIALEREGFRPDNTVLTFLCGRSYIEAVQTRWRHAHYRCHAPLLGMQIGEAMHWLDTQEAAYGRLHETL